MQNLENSINSILPELKVVEFNKVKHTRYIKVIRDLGDELNSYIDMYDSPLELDKDADPTEKISNDEYTELLLENGWRVFMGLLNGKCIGYVHIGISNFKKTIYIGSFIITSKFTDRGYGKQLMIRTLEIIKTAYPKEYSNVCISVHTNNKNALAIYKKVGFKPKTTFMVKKFR